MAKTPGLAPICATRSGSRNFRNSVARAQPDVINRKNAGAFYYLVN